MTLDEQIAVMTAFKNGKKIEYRYCETGSRAEWEKCLEPQWNWASFEYRVEPKKVKVWVALARSPLRDGELAAISYIGPDTPTWPRSSAFVKWIIEGEEYDVY